MGYYSVSHKSQYKGGNPVSDSLLGLKYIISEKDLSNIYGDPVFTGEDYAKHMNMTLDELKEATFSDEYKDLDATMLNVYLNKNALSLAFAANNGIYDLNLKDYNQWVSEDDERYNLGGFTSPFTRLNAMVTAILGEDETVEVFKPATQNGDPTVSQGVEVSTSSEHHKYVGDKGKITYSYTVPEGVRIYLFFPAYYNRAIKLSSSTMTIFDGTTSLDKCNERIVDLGYTEGTEYSLTVTINNTTGGGQFYTMLDDSFIYYVDTEVLDEAFSRIQKEQMIIDEGYKDDDIGGRITTRSDNRTILTTIPYDKGWEVYVDGERVETVEAGDALVSFKIDDAGEHTVRFLYRSSAFKVGIVITAISLAGFILIIIFEKKLKRLKLIRAFFVVEDSEPDVNSATVKNNKRK